MMKTGYSVQIQYEDMAALVKQLPLNLRCKMRIDVMEQAVNERLITILDDGRLHWTGGSNTLLAYFCGRMFCGDHGQYSRRKQQEVWVQGTAPFPHAELSRLFGVKALKQTRHRRNNMPLPACWEFVDALFDMSVDRMK